MPKRLEFLPLTKYQAALLDENVVALGFGDGVVRTFKRVQRAYGDKDHFATNKDGDVALSNGKVIGKNRNPNVINHKYTHKGVVYKYATRLIRRKDGNVTESRKLLPSINTIADYFRKSKRVQIDRSTRNTAAGGKRSPPKTAISPVIIRYPKMFDTVFIDSLRLPACTHDGDTYSWVFLCADYLTKFIHIAEVHQATELSKTKRGRAKATKYYRKQTMTERIISQPKGRSPIRHGNFSKTF